MKGLKGKKQERQPADKPVERKKRKKITIPKKAVAAILVIVGIGAFALTYGYIRPELVEQGEALEARNAELKVQINQLNELVANQASYDQQAEEFRVQNQEILDNFPAEVKEEDAILYAKEIEDESDYWINLIGITPGNMLYATGMSETTDTTADTTTEDESLEEDTTDTTAAADTGTGAAAGTQDNDLGILDASSVSVPSYQLYSMAASYDFTTSYEFLKLMVEKIQSDPEKRNVSSISLNYDTESGQLIGSMTVNLYYLTGTEKLYEIPDAGSIKKGKKNIFSTVKSKK